jgi:hypothetical protein
MGVFYAEFGAIMREFFGKHIYKCLTFPKTAYIALFCHFSASQKPKPTLLALQFAVFGFKGATKSKLERFEPLIKGSSLLTLPENFPKSSSL